MNAMRKAIRKRINEGERERERQETKFTKTQNAKMS